jgi:hypothetical protein
MIAEALNQMNSNIRYIQWSVVLSPSHCCDYGSGHWIQNTVLSVDPDQGLDPGRQN